MIKLGIKAIILLIIFSSNLLATDLFDNREVCAKNKGVWREFGNDCADRCTLDRGYNTICISKITFSCDCLEDKCWNHYQCVDNEEYQIKAQKIEDERIKKIKETNPELFIPRKIATKPQADGSVKNTDVRGSSGDKQNSKSQKDNKGKKDKKGGNSIEDKIASCASVNGVWKKFPNGCVDSCSSKSGPAICASVITESCDCGQGKCWDGTTCVVSATY